MKRFCSILFLVFTIAICHGQKNIKVAKQNLDSLPHHQVEYNHSNPMYMKPYENKSLSENYDTAEIDLSHDYAFWHSMLAPESEIKDSLLAKFDFSTAWLSIDHPQDGVLGLNYQRIQIYFSRIYKSKKDPRVYLVEGKSKVKNNICSFKGEMLISMLSYFNTTVETQNEERKELGSGRIVVNYSFYEDSSEYHSGVFEGVADCAFYLDSTGRYIYESIFYDDDFHNRTFVGKWTDYKTGNQKKCIWGDERLPFTFDFDIGEGGMAINPKYRKNGWETFDDGSEYYNASKDDVSERLELKDKWWLSK
jgi:hypothetical protein